MTRRKAKRNKDEEIVVANPGEASSVDPSGRGQELALYQMWAGTYGDTRVYIWADSLESAFEELVEWLDDNAPGILTTFDESDYRAAAKDLGIEWQPNWPDWEDRKFEKVAEQTEADHTVIGHTTLKHGTHIASDDWGGGEIREGSDEWNEVVVASFEDPDGPDYEPFDYSAFGPGKNEANAESGLLVSLDHQGDLTATEWTDREAATGEEQPEGEKWSTQKIYVGLRQLMDPDSKLRGHYSGDEGLSYGDLALLKQDKREAAIVDAAISAIAYGSLNEERFVDGLWEEADY